MNTLEETPGRPPLGPELNDDDVYDAMGRLPGYLDITTDDFRDLYRLAYGHAIERLVGGLRARDLMRQDDQALTPSLSLYRAAQIMAARRLKSMPVTDPECRVLGMLSETDVLERLGAATFLELMLQGPEQRLDRDRIMEETLVGAVMTAPAVTVAQDADFGSILAAFREHDGRRMPVVDATGRLSGMLARKDFIAACPLQMGS